MIDDNNFKKSAQKTELTKVNASDHRAIGIFDSGLGGLTVARAVRAAFPNEPICYLGDTARVPYGTKSPETVQLYTRQNIAFLLKQGVKFIIAACNTVSAAALPFLTDPFEVPVLGVVEMGAEAALFAVGAGAETAAATNLSGKASHSHRPATIGVIGTETTITSQAYVRAIACRAPHVRVVQKACPFFVPLIEELWLDHAVTKAVIAEYLMPMRDEGIDALILGCTHYPLIRPALGHFFGAEVQLVDSAEAMVLALHAAFESGTLRPAAQGDRSANSRYYVTDRGSRFQKLVDAFMGEPEIQVQQIASETLAECFTRAE